MSASALPDPQEVSYDLLLRCGLMPITWPERCLTITSRILAYLDLYGVSRDPSVDLPSEFEC